MRLAVWIFGTVLSAAVWYVAALSFGWEGVALVLASGEGMWLVMLAVATDG